MRRRSVAAREAARRSAVRLQRFRVQRIRQQLPIDQHLAIPREHDRALGGEGVEVGRVGARLERDRGLHVGGAGVDHRGDGELLLNPLYAEALKSAR